MKFGEDPLPESLYYFFDTDEIFVRKCGSGVPGALDFEGVPRQTPLPRHRGGRREHLYL